jgi:hypothetical protein
MKTTNITGEIWGKITPPDCSKDRERVSDGIRDVEPRQPRRDGFDVGANRV